MYEQVYENPDIYKIYVPLPNNPLKNLNCYVIKTLERNLIIDTGFNLPECYKALTKGLEELEIDIDKTDVFLTHLHADHTGLVKDIVSKNSMVYMSKIDYEYFINLYKIYCTDIDGFYVTEGFPRDEVKVLLGQNLIPFDSTEAGFNVTTFEDGFKFKIGQHELTCVITPGHTPGHTCLYLEKEKIMFLGDHILFHITPNICRWVGVKNSLKDYIESLEKIKGFEIQTAMPAHRNNDMDIDKRIDQLIEHHEVRLEEIFDLIEKQPGLNAYEIASQTKWSIKARRWEDFPIPQKWFATGETVAHLDYLFQEGKVGKDIVNGVFRYYPGLYRKT